ncbi:MAG: PIN domain-containing protein [Coriobacteriia bacterium]|nr:PIN domain-containing protein [Coriobacteriia bacterium]
MAVALQHIGGLVSIFTMASVNQAVLTAATNNGMKDFEDAVLLEAAKRVRTKVIITRNIKDFARSEIPALAPAEFLALPE